MSAVRRLIISPEWLRSKNAGPSSARWAKTFVLQIGNDPLADPVHEIEPRRAGDREDEADADQRQRSSCRSAAESLPPKPWSIMRRTAIGTASMASAETTSATTAPASAPLWARINGFSVSKGRRDERWRAPSAGDAA